MPRPARLAFAIPLLVTALAAGSAQADENNPAAAACKGKAEGDACSMMKLEKPEGGGELVRTQQAGTCQPGECCALDYSKGSPPDTTCGPCLVCEPGAAPAPTPAPDAKTEPAAEAPRAAGDDPPASPGNDKRGCTVGGRPDIGWAALLGLLLVFRRRRAV